MPVVVLQFSQFMLPLHGLRQPRFTTSSAGWQQKIRRNTLLDIELLARNGYHGSCMFDQHPAQAGGTFLFCRIRARTVIARQPPPCVTFFPKARRSTARTRAPGTLKPSAQPCARFGFSLADSNLPPLAWDAPNRFSRLGLDADAHMENSIQLFFRYRTAIPIAL